MAKRVKKAVSAKSVAAKVKKESANVTVMDTDAINAIGSNEDEFEVEQDLEMDARWAAAMQEINAEQAIKDAEQAEKKEQEEATKKRTGVIATILRIIEQSKKPVSKQAILSKLTKEFPNRSETSMTNTINAQIGGKKRPLRMEREKKVVFDITANDSGVRFYAIKDLG